MYFSVEFQNWMCRLLPHLFVLEQSPHAPPYCNEPRTPRTKNPETNNIPSLQPRDKELPETQNSQKQRHKETKNTQRNKEHPEKQRTTRNPETLITAALASLACPDESGSLRLPDSFIREPRLTATDSHCPMNLASHRCHRPLLVLQL